MSAQPSNRVLAIKSKFENLKTEEAHTPTKQRNSTGIKSHLNKHETNTQKQLPNDSGGCGDPVKSPKVLGENDLSIFKCDSSSEESLLVPNSSYLYAKTNVDKSPKKQLLSPKLSDPTKKLQRSHAFRCDKSKKMSSPAKGQNGSNEYMDKDEDTTKLKLEDLGKKLEDQMNDEKFVSTDFAELPLVSIPDKDVPKHILDQYARVLKPKRSPLNSSPVEKRHETMTDSGVSSETEHQEEYTEKGNRFKQIKAQFETAAKTDFTLHESVDDDKLDRSSLDDNRSDTISLLTRKNPHIELTETLKRALKQPLPVGPPPKKPPRTFQASPVARETAAESHKRKDTKQMLEKLEQVLHEREEKKTPLKKNSNKGGCEEIHYWCTEITDIKLRASLPSSQKTSGITKCLSSLSCVGSPTKSTISLPYTRMGSKSSSTKTLFGSSTDSIDKPIDNRHKFSTFFAAKSDDYGKLSPSQVNIDSKVLLDPNEHIYDEPNVDYADLRTPRMSMSSIEPEVVEVVTKVEIHKADDTIHSDVKSHSRSLQDLRVEMEEKIYDEPCNVSRSPSPELIRSRCNVESLRQNFENSTLTMPKPVISNKPKPLQKVWSDSKIRPSKSIDNVSIDFKSAKRNMEKFSFESKKSPGKFGPPSIGIALSLPKIKDQQQLHVDRENLSRLMNEIYETVSAACGMDDQQKPTRFPTDHSDGTSSEDSVKLTRNLTEKRKNYVRRMSSRAGCLEKTVKKRYRHQTSVGCEKPEGQYATFRSWKSFRQESTIMSTRRDSTDSKINLTDSKGNLLTMDFSEMDLGNLDISADDKAGCLDLMLPFEPKERGLFDICLLVGLNFMTGETYIRNVFPSQVKVPPHIGNLIFPERLTVEEASKPEYDFDGNRTQCYSLVLTNEKGERNFGYCRRVLPEGANYCLPLCYCIIGRYRAPGFYYKVLKEIESQHGSSEEDINHLLQQLIEFEFPNPGEELHISYNAHTSNIRKCFRNSVNLGDIFKPKMFQNKSPSSEELLGANTISEFYDIENNNNRHVFMNVDTPVSKVLKRPIEPRMDEDNLSILLDTLGPGLLVKVFGSLVLERKVVFISDSLSQLSSCMEALQSILYPFVWQQPLISTIPGELRKDILEAPLPILAGMLKRPKENTDYIEDIQFMEGMLIDISNSTTKLIFYQGDESTILPSVFYKTLKTTLQMESSKSQKDPEVERTRNVMISEAFLRFFVDILSDLWNHFTLAGEVKENEIAKEVIFNRESFTKDAPSKYTDFLDWFTETAMFNHFIENMASCYTIRQSSTTPIDYTTVTGIVDVPLPNFYQLFDERVMHKLSRGKKMKGEQKMDNPVRNNYKSAMNNKLKVLKNKLKDLVN